MKKYLKKPELIIAVVATIFRIFLSNLIGSCIAAPSPVDDELLFNYSNLATHFHQHNTYSLVKTMSYPLFLDLVACSTLSYTIVLSLVWVIGAILTVKLFKTFINNKWLLLLIYLFILFTPCAFEIGGVDLYRNSIIAPFVLITFCLIFINLVKIILENNFKIKRLLGLNIALGIIFTFTYYIKEDGIWLLPCLLLAVVINIVYLIFQKYKNKINIKKLATLSTIVILPVLIFVMLTNCYKAINYHYFGIYEINTRTEGECGKFVKNIYKIDSPDQNKCVWAPWDSIEKAFDTSPTLQSKSELKENLFYNNGYGFSIDNPIPGDFLTWSLRDALDKTGMYTSETDVNDFFKQVNVELDRAFKNGTLPKSHKFQISSSGGGRTFNEILDLKYGILKSYKCSVLLSGYKVINNTSKIEDPNLIYLTSKFINMVPTKIQSCSNQSYFSPQSKNNNIKINISNKFEKLMFIIYRLINPLLLIISFASILLFIFSLFKRVKVNKKLIFYFFSTVSLFGISLVYLFSVCWFLEFLGFNYGVLTYYLLEPIPILSLFYLFGLVLFIDNIKLLKEKRKPKNLIN